MSILDRVNWKYISYEELDSILRLHIDLEQGKSMIDDELETCLTPLCAACKHNREDLVTILFHHGANPEKRCSFYNKKPLHFACDHSNRNIGVVRKVLEAKANINAQDDDGNTGLHLACTESNVPVVELLLEHGADVNIADLDGETALVRACLARSHRLVETLLHAGCDPNVLSGTPLEIAVNMTSVETLKLLVESGADVQCGAYLAQASNIDHVEMMKVLRNYGASVNKANSLGMTPLHVACYSKEASIEAVNLLLEWGADIHAFSTTRETALHYACAMRNLDKVQLLLAYGAHPGVQGIHYVTPVTAALVSLLLDECESKETGNTAVLLVRLLLAAGAKLKPERLGGLRSSVVLVRGLEPATRQGLLDMLEKRTTEPSSLQDLCRICIRAATVPNIDKNVMSLPMPKPILRFLQFGDILKIA